MEHMDLSAILGMAESLNKAVRDFESTQDELTEVTGTAWSDDRLIKAVVGPRGQLIELEIDPRAVHRVNTDVLSATIVATTRAAAEQAMDRSRELVEQTLPDTRGVLGKDAPDLPNFARLAFAHDADLIDSGQGGNRGTNA